MEKYGNYPQIITKYPLNSTVFMHTLYDSIQKLERTIQICTATMILSFRTDSFEETVLTQIRLLLKEQPDQGLHCLQISLHLLDTLLSRTDKEDI